MSSCYNNPRRRQSLAIILLSILLSPFPWVGQGTRVLAQERTAGSAFGPDGDITFASASAKARGVLVEWRGKPDPNNLGFNVYRLQGGRRTRINAEVIPGAVFAGVRHVAPPGDYSYSRFDPTGTADSIYYIESVSVDGEVRSHDAIAPLRESQPASSDETWANNANSTPESSSQSQKDYPGGSALIASPSCPIEDQWNVAAQTGLKISIKSDGWYRVTQQQMSSAGFNPTVDIRNLSVFADGREVAIGTSKDVGQLTSGDYIEFYGRGLDTSTTDTRIYYLIAGTVAGKRIEGDVKTNSVPTPPLPVSLVSPSQPVQPSPQRWFGWLVEFLNGGADPVSTRPTIGSDPTPAQSNTLPPVENSPQANADTSAPYPAREKSEAAATALETAPKTEAALPLRTPASEAVKPEPTVNGTPRMSTKKVPVKRHGKRKIKHRTRREHRQAHASAAAAAVSFSYTVEFKQRFIYFSSLLNGDTENYFGHVVGAPLSLDTQTLNVPNPELSADGPAKLEVALQGVAGTFFLNHTVDISFNGTQVATLNFGPSDHVAQIITIPVSQLLNGANTVKFTKTSSGDACLVDYVRLTYPHAMKADNNALRFSLRSTQAAKIDGFAGQDIRLIDYTDPYTAKVIRPLMETTAAGYSISVSPGAPSKYGRLLYAISDTQFATPAAFSLNQPSTLNATSNWTKLLIIAHKSLIPSAAPLVSLRQSQGITASVVDVEDVYDEFSYGTHGPQAIKDFLSRANSSATPPKYIIFLGDADLDPRNYEGVGNFDLVPTKLIDATYNETASDDWLTDFDNPGDPGYGIGDIPSGRLPVRTPAEADLAISKIVGFTPTNAPQSALMVADDNTNPPYYFDFEVASDELVAFLPANMTVQKIYRRTQPSNCVARTNIINAMNQGVAVVNYSGHGSVNIWAGACPAPLPNDPNHTVSMFETGDAQALTNANRLPLVIVSNCLNGYFQDPRLEGIAEGFMKAQSGGAVGVFASSGETIPDGQRLMSVKLYQLLYGLQPIALGDAIKTSKVETDDIDVRRTWILFGDPSMKIR